jgi:hypothetical protein
VKTLLTTFFVLVAAGLIQLATASETPKTPAANLLPVRSVFAIPTNVREGRDPFFPESTRVFEAVAAATKTVEITALTVKGISGLPGHRLVIINNHTFGIGDEGDVLTPTGRVHIRCVEIRPDAVTIEINGQRHELHFGAQ